MGFERRKGVQSKNRLRSATRATKSDRADGAIGLIKIASSRQSFSARQVNTGQWKLKSLSSRSAIPYSFLTGADAVEKSWWS